MPGGIALLSLTLVLVWVMLVNAMPWPLYPQRKDPGPIVEEAGWAPVPVWTGAEILAPPPRFSPQTVQSIASHYTDWAVWPSKWQETSLRLFESCEGYSIVSKVKIWIAEQTVGACTSNHSVPAVNIALNQDAWSLKSEVTIRTLNLDTCLLICLWENKMRVYRVCSLLLILQSSDWLAAFHLELSQAILFIAV
jgi:hypothetical protein